jgi:hypothetical protein
MHDFNLLTIGARMRTALSLCLLALLWLGTGWALS